MKYLRRLLYTRPVVAMGFEKPALSPNTSKITLKNSSPLLTASNALLRDISSPEHKQYILESMSPDLRVLEENQNKDYNCSLSEDLTDAFDNVTSQEAAARQATLEAEDLRIMFDEWLLKSKSYCLTRLSLR